MTDYQPMRLSRWPGNDATGRPIISKSTKMSLLRDGKLRSVRLAGGTWIMESWRDFVARQAAEQGQDVAAE